MSSRLSISTMDLRRLLDLTDLARVDEPGSPLPWSVLNGLADLIGCDSVTYESYDVVNRNVPYQATSSIDGGGDFADDSVQASFGSLYRRGLCDYWPRTGDCASARPMPAGPDWPTWQHTADGEWICSVGIHGEITIALPPHAGRQYRLLLWPFTGRDFTERDWLRYTLPSFADRTGSSISRPGNGS